MPGFETSCWLRNPHFQTMWPRMTRPAFTLDLEPERVELPDGDFIDLLWTSNDARHIVMVFHGLEG